MVTSFRAGFVMTWKRTWFVSILLLVYTSIAVWLYFNKDFDLSIIGIIFSSILFTALSLFLAFRTNSAYERWWEARKAWGAILNDNRSLVRQLVSFTNGKESDMVELMCRRQILWNYTFTAKLRQIEISDMARDYRILSPGSANDSQTLLNQQGQDIQKLADKGIINQYQQMTLENTLMKLTDSMGVCERIKNTVFPVSYILFTMILLIILVAFGPFAMAEDLNYMAIPVNLIIGYSFYVIESIGFALQDPFSNSPTDTPMLAISRTAEKDILMSLRKEELPELLQAKAGVLM